MIQHFTATDKHFTAMKLFWRFGLAIMKCQSIYSVIYTAAFALCTNLPVKPLAKTAYRDIWIILIKRKGRKEKAKINE